MLARHTSVERDVPELCGGAHDAAVVGRARGDHAVEALARAALIYILVAKARACPSPRSPRRPVQRMPWNYVILFADALLYTFFTVVFSTTEELIQGALYCVAAT